MDDWCRFIDRLNGLDYPRTNDCTRWRIRNSFYLGSCCNNDGSNRTYCSRASINVSGIRRSLHLQVYCFQKNCSTVQRFLGIFHWMALLDLHDHRNCLRCRWNHRRSGTSFIWKCKEFSYLVWLNRRFGFVYINHVAEFNKNQTGSQTK